MTSSQILAIEKMTSSEKEIAIASSQVKVSHLDKNELKESLLKLVGKTHLDCGFKVDKETLSLTIDTLRDDLQKYNPTLSFQEIEIAFKNGWKKEYGDFFGLNNSTYFQWVNAYAWGEKRLRVKKTLLEAKENQNKEAVKLSKTEQDKILKEACLKSFEDFKNEAILFDAGNVKYNYLVKIGVLNVSLERKKEFMTLAETNLKEIALETKQKTEPIEKCFAKILPQSLQSEAKKLALKDFFQGLIDNEFKLTEIIEQ